MGAVIVKEEGANYEELVAEFDNALSSYLIASQKGGTGEDHPIVIRRGNAHGIKIDTGEVYPVTDGNTKLGLRGMDDGGPKMFTQVVATNTYSSDYVFENGYVLTEADHVYENMDPKDGIFLMDPNWRPVALFSYTGELFLAGHITENYDFDEPDIPRRS